MAVPFLGLHTHFGTILSKGAVHERAVIRHARCPNTRVRARGGDLVLHGTQRQEEFDTCVLGYRLISGKPVD